MPHHQASPDRDGHLSPTEMLLDVIKDANRIFAGRHNWRSPATTEHDRQQFVSRCCDWWNYLVCPAMDRCGAVWNEAQQRFEIPARDNSDMS